MFSSLIGEQGIRLLSRYVSITHGFTYLEEVKYLYPLVDAWKTNYNREYVGWIELEIMESLSSYDRRFVLKFKLRVYFDEITYEE